MPAAIDLQSDEDLKRAVREILAGCSDKSRLATLSDNTDLFGAGIVNSFGILQLITDIEDKLAVTIPADELIPQNLWSVASICALVKRLALAAP